MPMIKVRTLKNMQPPKLDALEDSVMILVIPMKTPSAIVVLQAGSVASLNLSSMGFGWG